LIKALMDEKSASLMALRDLKKATNNFSESAQIGEGGFGAVYIGRLSDGKTVAIKRSKREGSEKDKDQFLNEVRILSQISHRHLVKLLGCCMESHVALLVFEFFPNGTLQEHLQREVGDQSLSWENRLDIAIQTAEALNYLHSGATFPIYHRDVKSANILLNDDLHAKVADFGISRLVPTKATHVSTVAVQGTLGYIDPDYYTSFKLNDKSDVYSFQLV
jgi:serine/threonine protein kinase